DWNVWNEMPIGRMTFAKRFSGGTPASFSMALGYATGSQNWKEMWRCARIQFAFSVRKYEYLKKQRKPKLLTRLIMSQSFRRLCGLSDDGRRFPHCNWDRDDAGNRARGEG